MTNKPAFEAFPSQLAKELDNVLAIANEALQKIPRGEDEPFQSWLTQCTVKLKKAEKVLEDYLG